MATVATLRAEDSAHFGYLLVVESMPYAWTDIPDLHGNTTYLDWSDGSTVSPSKAIEIKLGLEVPKQIKMGGDFRSDQLLERSPVSFVLNDEEDGYLADLFKAHPGVDPVLLWQEIRPDDGAFGAVQTEEGAYDAKGKYIGPEFIGPLGQRRYRWIAPNNTPSGFHHRGENELLGQPPILIHTEPHEFKGLKCALYEIVYDRHSESWTTHTWDDQYDGGSLIWVGTLKDSGRIAGPRRWAIKCDSHDSWLKKPLNTGRPSHLGYVLGALYLEPEERGIACWFQEWDASGGALTLNRYDGYYTWDNADALNAELGATPSGDDVFDSIATILSDIHTSPDSANLTEGIGNWGDSDAQRDYTWQNQHEIAIRMEDNNTDQISCQLFITMHYKAWLAMGWDPFIQRDLALDDKYYVDFYGPPAKGAKIKNAPGQLAAPGDGYVTARFTTEPALSDDDAKYGKADNEGKDRYYYSLWPGDITILDGSTTEIAVSADSMWIEGQHGRPFNIDGDHKLNGTATDRAGWFVFRGKILRDPQAGPEDFAQVAFCSWVNVQDGEGIEVGGDGEALLYVERWEDPRLFGLPYEPVDKTANHAWVAVAGSIEVIPIAVLGGLVEGDYYYASAELTKLLTSSGSSTGWSGLVPDFGDNTTQANLDDPDVNNMGLDLEIQDLGLNIPDAWVDIKSALVAAETLGGEDAQLNRWMASWNGPLSSWDLIQWICQGRGLGLSYKRTSGEALFKFGLLNPFRHLSPQDAEITITDNEIAGDAGEPMSWFPSQDIRLDDPVDVFQVSARMSPADNRMVVSKDYEAQDSGRAYRQGLSAFRIKDGGMTGRDATGVGPAIDLEFRQRFQQELASWYAQRHFLITINVDRVTGDNAGIGSVVMYTDTSRPVAPDGTYGLSQHMGHVIGVTRPLGSEARKIQLQCLMQATPTTVLRFWGPIARPYGWDSGTGTLDLSGPWGGNMAQGEIIQGAYSDRTGFTAEDWMTGTGNLKAYLWQSETGAHGDWDTSLRVTCEISANGADPHQLTLTGVSGTIYRDMHKILTPRPYADQAAGHWSSTHFAVHTGEDGKHGAVKAAKLV